MGSSASQDDDSLGALPQQQIVNMSDGQPVAGQAPLAPGVVGRIGTSMTGTAVIGRVFFPQIPFSSN
jgi:hypothetical protein